MTDAPDPRKPHGDTVSPEGVLRYVSPSSLKLADDTTESGCPRKFALQKLRGLKEPDSEHTIRGKVIHAEYEVYWQTGERGHMSAQALAGIPVVPPPGPDLAVELSMVPVNPETGLEDLALAPVRPAGVPMYGRIDCMHARGINYGGPDIEDTLDPPGTIEIFDTKTVKKISKFLKKPADLPSDIQMVSYAKYAWAVHPRAPYVRLSLGYVPMQGTPRKVSLRVLPEQIEDTWNRIEGLTGYLRDACTTLDPDQFRANTNACNAFGKVCIAAPQCSAYGAKNPFARIAARAAQLSSPDTSPPAQKSLFSAHGVQAVICNNNTMPAQNNYSDEPKAKADTGKTMAEKLATKKQGALSFGKDEGTTPDSNESLAAAEAQAVALAKRDLEIRQAIADIRRLGFGFVTMTGQGAIDVARAENLKVEADGTLPGQSVLKAFNIDSADLLPAVLEDATRNQAKLRARLQAAEAESAKATTLPSDAPPPTKVVTTQPAGPITPVTPPTSDAAKTAIAETAAEKPAPKKRGPKPKAAKADDAPAPETAATAEAPAEAAPVSVATPSGIVCYVDVHFAVGAAPVSLNGIVDGILLAINEEVGAELGAPGPVDFRLAKKDGKYAFTQWKAYVQQTLEKSLPPGEYCYDTMGGNDVSPVVLDTLRQLCANTGGRLVLGRRGL